MPESDARSVQPGLSCNMRAWLPLKAHISNMLYCCVIIIILARLMLLKGVGYFVQPYKVHRRCLRIQFINYFPAAGGISSKFEPALVWKTGNKADS